MQPFAFDRNLINKNKSMKFNNETPFRSAIMIILFMVATQFAMAQSSETRELRGFEEVSVGSGINLYIKQGEEYYVEVIAEDRDDLEKIKTEVVGGRLKISYKRSGWGFNWNNKMEVRVTMPDIYEINASGGADVYGVNLIRTKDLELGASGGADIKLEVEVGNLILNSSGGSDIELSGKALFLEGQSSGGSDIKAYDLRVKRAKLNASGGSDIQITVIEELEANASGGSDIYYKGNPTKVRSNSGASGDVNHVN
ncbi:MAG TPA: DUF2807 domain-containing protein [Cytophagales bacterium]|nr:DUF2807 domain-containing protein [Cytophagales bacterium]